MWLCSWQDSMFPQIHYQVSTRNLMLLIVFYILWTHYSHFFFSYKYPLLPNKLYIFKHLDYKPKKILVLLTSLTRHALFLSILANYFCVNIFSHFVIQDLHSLTSSFVMFVRTLSLICIMTILFQVIFSLRNLFR